MEMDNREIASLFWLFVLAAWALSKQDIRSSLRPIGSSLRTLAISVPIVLLLLYISAVVTGLQRAGLWSVEDLKDTLLWTLGFALIGLFETPQIASNPGRLRAVVSEVFGLAVIVEFALNAYVMRLWAEMIFVPVVTFVVLGGVVAASKKDLASVGRFLGVVQAILGFVVLGFAIREMVADFDTFWSLETLRRLALPAVLSLSFVPFLYAMALFIAYDSLFRLIGWRTPAIRVRRYARRRVFVMCHFNIGRLRSIQRIVARTRFETRDDVDSALAATETA